MPSVADPLLDALRAQVRAIESVVSPSADSHLPFGVPAIDERLAGGGLARGALHEAAAPYVTSSQLARLDKLVEKQLAGQGVLSDAQSSNR